MRHEGTIPDMRQAVPSSQRQLRVGETIRHALADIFARNDIGDPTLEEHSVTVLEVTISRDLRHATVYIRVFAHHDPRVVLEALERAAKCIRAALATRIRLKFLPHLRFRLDHSIDYAQKIDALLARPEVMRDLEGL
ncbi:MAG: 30S ribosome-binding factor RbfA [Hyphomicrobiales bacterium]